MFLIEYNKKASLRGGFFYDFPAGKPTISMVG